MNIESTGPMEQEIITEENISEPVNQKNECPKLKLPKIKIHLTLKKPKLITLVSLVGLIFVIYLGLLLLSSKGQDEIVTAPPPLTTTTSPKSLINPQFADLSKEIETYNNQLDNFRDYQKKLAPPQVQLDISFEK